MSNHKAVSRYNDIAKDQFDIHNIKKRLDEVDKLTRICGRPGPKWLTSIIVKLYKQWMRYESMLKTSAKR